MMAFFEGNISADEISGNTVFDCSTRTGKPGVPTYVLSDKASFRQGSQGKPEELRTYQIITTEPKVQIFKNKGKIDFNSLRFSDTAFFHALHNSGCLC